MTVAASAVVPAVVASVFGPLEEMRDSGRIPAAMLPTPPLRLGAMIALATLGFAAVVGLIAVIDADAVQNAVAVGVGVAATVFAAGATIACGLACLDRGRLEIPALAGVAVAGIAVDLLVLAAWLEIDNEAYGKVTGIAFVWTFFGLLVLGLTLAVGPSGDLARALYLAAVATTAAAGLISTWLVATAGSVFGNPVEIIGDDGLLRALGAAFVLLAALWFAALAASRLERATR